MAEIIGVVGDVRHRALDEELSPTVYVSAWQSPSRSSILVVRSPRPDVDVIAAVREEVARLDRDLPVYRVRSMRDVVAASPGVPERRVLTATFMGFALLAVVLGGIRLFGVVAHGVASRRVELAVRIALGADPRRILMSTLGQGAWMVGAGLAVGGVLSVWARARSAAWSSRRAVSIPSASPWRQRCSSSLVSALSCRRPGARRAPIH
jgi:putative ABC transport system permease protein